MLIIFSQNISHAKTVLETHKTEPEEFKSYLHNIKSIAVEFTQTDSTGKKAVGKLLIDKPYKFRCNYYPPFPLLIVGNKNYASVYDYEMEHLSRIKAEDNIFNFLLVDNIDFEKYFRIESITDTNNTLIISLYHIGSDKLSQITFDRSTKQLKTIKIIEDDNVITIELGTVYKVKKIAGDLFILKNPHNFGPPPRLSRKAIEGKYEPLS